MRAVVQRVSAASVTAHAAGPATPGGALDAPAWAAIGPGLVAFVGVGRDDGPGDAERLAAKVVALRVFEDAEGRMNRSLADVGGALLAVSQFTLLADTRKGNRPSFGPAAPPEDAAPLFDAFVAAARACGVDVATGVFGAEMTVELANEGPVTILLDTR